MSRLSMQIGAIVAPDAKQDDDGDLGVSAGTFNFSGNPAAAIVILALLPC
jgi:hypothetical protein